MTKKLTLIAALALCAAAPVHAEDRAFSMAAGFKAWNMAWSSFHYETTQQNQSVITQDPAREKIAFIPLLSARYGEFAVSLSGYPSTDFEIANETAQRKELDLNAGYFVTPAVALTLGYKRLSQGGSGGLYALAGPVAGVNATAPLGNGYSLYGAFALGWLKPTSASTVFYDADYRLSEAGLAYTLATPRIAKAVSFTLGYRSQVLVSKEATATGDAHDLTHGISFGVIAAF